MKVRCTFSQNYEPIEIVDVDCLHDAIKIINIMSGGKSVKLNSGGENRFLASIDDKTMEVEIIPEHAGPG